MNPYLLVLLNSFQASFVFSIHSENAWFAAHAFGGYNMLLATAMAVMGATIGNGANFALGYYLSTKRDDWFHINDGIYRRISRCFCYAIILLLFPFPGIPILSTFWALFVVLCGLFRTPTIITITLIIIGRIAYYSFLLS